MEVIYHIFLLKPRISIEKPSISMWNSRFDRKRSFWNWKTTFFIPYTKKPSFSIEKLTGLVKGSEIKYFYCQRQFNGQRWNYVSNQSLLCIFIASLISNSNLEVTGLINLHNKFTSYLVLIPAVEKDLEHLSGQLYLALLVGLTSTATTKKRRETMYKKYAI